MSLEWGQPTLETPRSLAAKAAVATVTEVSSAHDVFAQVPPPPARSRAALLPFNPALHRCAAARAQLPWAVRPSSGQQRTLRRKGA